MNIAASLDPALLATAQKENESQSTAVELKSTTGTLASRFSWGWK